MTGMQTAVVQDFVYYSEGPVDRPPVVSDPSHFGMQVTVLIGTDDDRPGDAFRAFPGTGSWLAAELAGATGLHLADSLVTEHDEGVRPLAGVWSWTTGRRSASRQPSTSCAARTARHRTGAPSPPGSAGSCRGSTTTASTTSSTSTRVRRSRRATQRWLWTGPTARSRPVDSA